MPVNEVFNFPVCNKCDVYHKPHLCTDYICNYITDEPKARRCTCWKKVYAQQKKKRGEAAALRSHALKKNLLRGRQFVCTDTSSEGQRKSLLESYSSHWSHHPSPPVSCETDRDGEIDEKTQPTPPVSRSTAIFRSTPITRSRTVPWVQQYSKAYEDMVALRQREFDYTGQVNRLSPREIKELRRPRDAMDVCAESGIEMTVGAWPADITKARALCLKDNCWGLADHPDTYRTHHVAGTFDSGVRLTCGAAYCQSGPARAERRHRNNVYTDTSPW